MIDLEREKKVRAMYPVAVITEAAILGKPINLDAGVTCGKYHWGQPDAMDIYMYLGLPGRYYTIHGTPVPEAFAAEAGFDVVRLGIERQSIEMMAEAEQVIRARLAIKDDAPVFEHGGYKVMAPNGLGHSQIMDPYGHTLLKQTIPVDDAIGVVKRLTGYVEPENGNDDPTEE